MNNAASGVNTAVMYGLTRCDTCVKARKWLAAHQVPYEFIDYREQPVPPATLLAWAQQLGGWEKLVNRASTSWRNLTEAERNPAGDEGWQALIACHPALVKRPVLLTADGTVSVGFKDAAWAQRLGM